MPIEQLAENDPSLHSFVPVPEGSDFPIQNLPYGVFSTVGDERQRLGVAIGDYVLDLSVLADADLLTIDGVDAAVFYANTLNPFMALGKVAWRAVRAQISVLLREETAALRDDSALREKALVSMTDVKMHLPIKVSGYTDFYSSIEHATNVGTMFRGKDNALMPNWRHLPVGYDGRASSVVVSGTDLHRPCGQIKPGDDAPAYSPSQKMDTEVELAFIVGVGSELGEPIAIDAAEDHVFGAVILADWSARDIQKWEYVPLGPFLGKNFGTTISPWVVTLDALEPFRHEGCAQEPKVLDYLQSSRDWSYDISLALSIQTKKMEAPHQVSVTSYKLIYWDFPQQVAHHSVNGCSMETGDVFASGTISGTTPDSCGSFLEITYNGRDVIDLPNGEKRTFMEDGDTVAITAWAKNDAACIGFGEAKVTLLPARR
jgi:fumarylacetoacetase